MEHEALNNVRRKINEVMKKTDERIVVGWRPSLVQERKEGEEWTDENGKLWTVKNGIKQSVSKLQDAKTPWWCPECKKSMSHRLDEKMWRKTGKCMDCVVREETEIRRRGEWDRYEWEKMRANYIAEVKDKIQELQHYYDNVSSPEFLYADDTKILMTERWNVDIDRVKAALEKDISDLKIYLSKVEEMTYENQTPAVES